MASKYPSLTPYHYCANNPEYYIDENGEFIFTALALFAVGYAIDFGMQYYFYKKHTPTGSFKNFVKHDWRKWQSAVAGGFSVLGGAGTSIVSSAGWSTATTAAAYVGFGAGMSVTEGMANRAIYHDAPVFSWSEMGNDAIWGTIGGGLSFGIGSFANKAYSIRAGSISRNYQKALRRWSIAQARYQRLEVGLIKRQKAINKAISEFFDSQAELNLIYQTKRNYMNMVDEVIPIFESPASRLRFNSD